MKTNVIEFSYQDDSGGRGWAVRMPDGNGWAAIPGCDDLGPALDRVVTKIVARAIRRDVKLLRGNKKPWAKKYRGWARRWLNGEDRSRAAAATAADAYAITAAYAATHFSYAATIVAYAHAVYSSTSAAADVAVGQTKEQGLQARDVRDGIPSWSGKV